MTRGPAPYLFRATLFVALVALAGILVWKGAQVLCGEDSFVHHVRTAPPRGEIRGRATLVGDPDHSALCIAIHEHWQQCGKHQCWAPIGELYIAQGRAEIDGADSLKLDGDFRIEPSDPVLEYGAVTTRSDEIKALGASTDSFGEASFATGGSHQIREWCAPEESPVWIATCSASGTTVPCADRSSYVIALGDGTPEVAVGAYVDRAFLWFAAAAIALLFAVLTRLGRRTRLAVALSARAHGQSAIPNVLLGLLAAALAVFTFVLVLPHAVRSDFSNPAYRDSYGWGGEAWIGVATAGTLLGAILVLRRRHTLGRALRFVTDISKRSLGDADGTVGIFVRAEAHDDLVGLMDSAPLAFSRASLRERTGSGKSAQEHKIQGPDDLPAEIAVSDAAGTGTLRLEGAILDVETTTKESVGVPESVRTRFGDVVPQENHSAWIIVEERIRANEDLLVFGEVSAVTLHAGGGYRSTARAPTLGGFESPVLVYAGRYVDLTRELDVERRAATMTIALWISLLAAIVVVTNVLQHW